MKLNKNLFRFAGSLLLVFAIPMRTEALPADTVFIDLDKKQVENNAPGAVTVGPIVPVAGTNANQVVLKVNLQKTFTGFSKAVFNVSYGKTPTGSGVSCTVNIGDSQTNDGGSGDSGTQSNDAEIGICNNLTGLPIGTLVVWGKDGTAIPAILTVPGYASAGLGKTVSFTIGNNLFGFDGNSVTSSQLFALNGQSDTEGTVNYDIYASFNRVINSTSRNGSGVSSIMIHLLP
jgi:hypothetical protein